MGQQDTLGVELLEPLPTTARVVVILAAAVLAHLATLGLRRFVELRLTPDGAPVRDRKTFAHRFPKVATVSGLVSSALTFLIYFVALGLILAEFDISLTAYVATASVLGLAVAFGAQGLVQDIVIGLTLLVTDALDVGDVIEVAGHVGRVQNVGLRFTTIVDHVGQTVYVPNRSITHVGRYRNGRVRVIADVEIPESLGMEHAAALVDRIARGVRAQYPTLIVAEPELMGSHDARPGDWRYVRVRFRVWPGQTAIVEAAFRPRIVAAMKELEPGYQDWMVSISQRRG